MTTTQVSDTSSPQAPASQYDKPLPDAAGLGQATPATIKDLSPAQPKYDESDASDSGDDLIEHAPRSKRNGKKRAKKVMPVAPAVRPISKGKSGKVKAEGVKQEAGANSKPTGISSTSQRPTPR